LLRDAADAAKSMRRIRLYSRLMLQEFKDKIYRKKVRPTAVAKMGAEDLYDENIQLKQKLNQIE
jgi:hypothetical protein